jgi:hypothetical protein
MRRVFESPPLRSVDIFNHDSAHINDLRANHLCQSQAVCASPGPAPLDASPVHHSCDGLVRDHAAHRKRVRFTPGVQLAVVTSSHEFSWGPKSLCGLITMLRQCRRMLVHHWCWGLV